MGWLAISSRTSWNGNGVLDFAPGVDFGITFWTPLIHATGLDPLIARILSGLLALLASLVLLGGARADAMACAIPGGCCAFRWPCCWRYFCFSITLIRNITSSYQLPSF